MATRKRQSVSKNHPSPPLMVSITEAARLLGISRTTFLVMNDTGKLGPRSHKYGRRVLWERAELEDWVKAGSPSRRTWANMKSKARRR